MITVQGQPFPLRARIHYLIPPGLSFAVRTRRPVRQVFAHFETVALPDRFCNAPIALPASIARDHLIEQVAGKLMGDTATMDTQVQWQLRAIVYDAFASIADDFPQEILGAEQAITQESMPVMPALRIIQDFFIDRLDNSFLAAQCNMSESHFIRVFRQHVGQTPAQYILAYRLQVAVELLVTSECPIDEIARTTGFCHRAHFANAFKRMEGMPPAVFRQRHRQNESTLATELT